MFGHVLNTEAQQQASELQTKPYDSHQSASMPERGSHEAANILECAAQQEMPGVDEKIDSHQSLFGPTESTPILGRKIEKKNAVVFGGK